MKSTLSDNDEEMSIDEYNVMRAENLLLDPILTEVMDTTLRIGVADRIYKITEYGTFSVPSNKVQLLDDAVKNFNKNLLTDSDLGDYVDLGDDIIFTNSFGENTPTDNVFEEIPTNEIESVLKSVSTYNNNLHNGYNVNTYNWQNNSVWQNIWDAVGGKDVSKENNFSSDRRVQVNVFNVNYAFYASSGIKVKMQKSKNFLFVKYWVDENADKLAIGFNKVYGEMKYTNPASFSKIMPTGSTQWGNFTGHLNGYISRFVYGQYKKFDLVKDWVDDIYMFLPEVTIVGNTYPNQKLMNQLYEIPADQMYSFLKGQAGKYVYTPIQKQIQPKDPRIAYVVWGNSVYTYDKDKSYIMGVKEYGRSNGKTVRFDRSFGFTINNGSVGGFVPTEFKIKDLDVFGAAYNKSQWKGVRFIKK